MSQETSRVRFRSFNPYEARYPGRRVVSRETLHLMKRLRSEGFEVVVDPEDGSKLNYLAEKGIREWLSDPVCALIVGIPLNLVLNVVSSWLYDKLKRAVKENDTNLVLEIDEQGTRVRYSHTGKPVSEKRFKTLLDALEARSRTYAASLGFASPDPSRPIPLYLEHSAVIVGWGRASVDSRGLRLENVIVTDDRTRKRIEKGELRGASFGGLIYSSTCSICGGDYAECNHIAGSEYDGSECTVQITGVDLAEISVVREPVQPGARLKMVRPED